MPRNHRSWLYFGGSMAALATSAVLVGMTNHRPAPTSPKTEAVAGFTSLELQAKNALKMELERRFTDRQNVDFGMSRVIRKGTRLHFGPTMDKQVEFKKEDFRTNSNGVTERKINGEWVKNNDLKPLMSPENENETAAMKTLRDAKVDVAIYTVGQFEMDKGEKPAPQSQPPSPNPNYMDFAYGRGESIRAKGPAYTNQDSTMAPKAYEIVDFGRRAWASNQVDYMAEGKDGWVYFAHRVASNDASCARCHGDRKVWISGKAEDIQGAVKKIGDPVGVFVIALRRADAK